MIKRAGAEPAPITMPPVIGLPPALEAPPGPQRMPSGEASVGRERMPTSFSDGSTAVTASFRVGYPEYLREAKIGEVAALALPGVADIVALTALGGLLGYRQAKAGHFVRAAGTARFLQ